MWASIFYSLKHVLDFNGRAGRAEYLIFCGFLLVCDRLIGWRDELAWQAAMGKVYPVPAVTYWEPIFQKAAIALMLALQVRRLHDFDLSGWWVLAFSLPWVLKIFPLVGEHIDTTFWLWGIVLAFVLPSAFLRGMKAENRHGRSPLATSPDRADP
ncbi:DUF805 domain-containing protein [Kordiimonas lipolytica]|uniref:DUF805 domain-containing protein n=1 Tax=Kordiimonas lipolytica TaxID=1662421 RepID=A0ABV8U7L5_9PROT|nr:DUF805 domain-containing protein [Kordiimonas lipolytica]